MWGGAKISITPRHNDHVYVYVLIIARPENRGYFQYLVDGVTSRQHIEDPSLSLKWILMVSMTLIQMIQHESESIKIIHYFLINFVVTQLFLDEH